MKFAWVLNLDAELELERLEFPYVPRVKLLAQLARFGAGSRALLGAQDRMIEHGSGAASGFVGRAWCPTPRAIQRLMQAGIEPEPHPDAAILRTVNHRLFAHRVGGGLPGQQYHTERAPLEELLRRAERPWLCKRPLAFAGRGQMRFYGRITDKQWSWLDVSLRKDGVLVEPLVTPTLELSLHGFIWPTAGYELGRICIQQVSERGVFRGVRLAEPGELPASEARQVMMQGEHVAMRLREAGYFGPFGIDAHRYEIDGELGFCALSEINARYTMGFVTGFPRHPSRLALR